MKSTRKLKKIGRLDGLELQTWDSSGSLYSSSGAMNGKTCIIGLEPTNPMMHVPTF